MSNTVIEVW